MFKTKMSVPQNSFARFQNFVLKKQSFLSRAYTCYERDELVAVFITLLKQEFLFIKPNLDT